MAFADYKDRYSHFVMERDEQGILTVSINDGSGNPVTWNLSCYEQAIPALIDIGADQGNRVVILTGAGDAFIGGADLGDPSKSGTPTGFNPYFWHGSRIAQRLLDIHTPVIAALNGPVRIHTEIALLSDLVIASDTTYFQDGGHIPGRIVPGDGAQVIWEELLGPVRSRFFLWTSQQLSADECLTLGVVNEVHPPGEVMPRARALAEQLAQLPDLTLQYTRLALTQRLKRRFVEAVPFGMALEGLTVVDVSGSA